MHMKNIFTIFFTIFSFSLIAQSLTLSQDTVFLRFGEKIDYGDYFINNNSNGEIDIDCTIKPTCYDSDDDTAIAICFGALCFSPINTETTYGDLTQDALITIPGQGQDDTFKFEPFSSESYGSSWDVIFFDRNNPDDKATLTVFVSNCQLSNTKEAFEKLGFTIFPNPVQNQLNLDFVSTISEKRITIYNSIGQVLRKDIVASGNSYFSTNVSNLSNGNYFIEIADDAGLKYVEQFSKF